MAPLGPAGQADPAGQAGRLRPGRVVDFDHHVGLGTIRGDDGRDYPFHCTQIADGTRSIAAGTDIEFEVVAGHLGRWEATGIRPRT